MALRGSFKTPNSACHRACQFAGGWQARRTTGKLTAKMVLKSLYDRSLPVCHPLLAQLANRASRVQFASLPHSYRSGTLADYAPGWQSGGVE